MAASLLSPSLSSGIKASSVVSSGLGLSLFPAYGNEAKRCFGAEREGT